jgi:hypothetical protein
MGSSRPTCPGGLASSRDRWFAAGPGRLDKAGRVGDLAQGIGGQRPQRRDRDRDIGFKGIRALPDEVPDRLGGPDIPAHQALGYQPGP